MLYKIMMVFGRKEKLILGMINLCPGGLHIGKQSNEDVIYGGIWSKVSPKNSSSGLILTVH